MRPRIAAAVLSLLSLLGAAACGGGRGGGSSVGESLSGIFPSRVYTGRSYAILVSGVETGWAAGTPPAVDFGPGVTVVSLLVASETALVADVDVEADAPVGPRDVTVGDAPFSGFEVKPSMSFTLLSGAIVQGSTFEGRIDCLDPETPFDDDPFVEGPVGMGFLVTRRDPLEVDVIGVVDPASPPGPFALRLQGSALPLLRVDFPLAGAGTVEARAPLTTFPAAVTVTGPDSGLHGYVAGASAEFVRFTYQNTGGDDVPAILSRDPGFWFFQEFHANDSTTQRETLLGPGETVWVTVSPSDGFSTSYTLDVAAIPTPMVATVGPNSTQGTAMAVTPPVIVDGIPFQLSSQAEFYSVVVGAGDVGKVLRVVTSGSYLTSPEVRVTRADGVTVLGTYQDPNGFFQHADFVTVPLPAAETIYVRVRPNQIDFSDFHPGFPWRLMLRLEAP